MIVEDGTGLSNADSYVEEEAADEYFDARGNATWLAATSEDKQAALVRGTAAIDAIYGIRFTGWKLNGREQSLQWPRYGAYDITGFLVASDAVPIEVMRATFEAAYRELVSPGSMLPDLNRGGDIKKVQAGSVAVEYFEGAQAETTWSLIEGILAPLLGAPNIYTARAVRA